LGEPYGLVAQPVAIGAMVQFSAPVQSLLRVHLPEIPGAQNILEEGVLIHPVISAGTGNSFGLQGGEEFAAGDVAEVLFLIAASERNVLS